LTRFIYESGYLVGNDSGLGHLASFLGVPTCTITRRKALAKLWAPSYTPGAVVTPPPWVPNIRGLRLRDRYWQSFISVEKVLFAFDKLTIPLVTEKLV
jgi:heptosyltransferase-3